MIPFIARNLFSFSGITECAMPRGKLAVMFLTEWLAAYMVVTREAYDDC